MRLVALPFLLALAACSSEATDPGSGSVDASTDSTATSDSAAATDAVDATLDTATPDAVADEGVDTNLDTALDVLEAGSGTLPPCSTCAKSSDCGANMVCVDLGFGAPGRFCAYDQAKVGDCTTVRPYRKAESLPLAGGGSAVVCVPSIATCQSVGMFKQKCTTGKNCGPGGDCWAKSSASFVCTLECKDDLDCPVGSTCEVLGTTTTVKRCLW